MTAADRAPTVSLWRDAGLTRPWNDPEADFDRAQAGPTSIVLGAFDSADLAATVMVGHDGHDGHRGWVYYLAVPVVRRRSGLGRRMMDAAEEWLRVAGVPKLNLMVRRSNQEAFGFYERLGYTDSEVTVLARWLQEPS